MFQQHLVGLKLFPPQIQKQWDDHRTAGWMEQNRKRVTFLHLLSGLLIFKAFQIVMWETCEIPHPTRKCVSIPLAQRNGSRTTCDRFTHVCVIMLWWRDAFTRLCRWILPLFGDVNALVTVEWTEQRRAWATCDTRRRRGLFKDCVEFTVSPLKQKIC